MTDAEQWLPLFGFEKSHEVSQLGHIRSVARTDRLGRPVKGRILSPYVGRGGYLVVDLWREGQRQTKKVHIAVIETWVGQRTEGLEVRHLNGDPMDNRLANLRYGSRSENQLDSVEHGTHNQARKNECPKCGAAYSTQSNGERFCRSCRNEKVRLRWASRTNEDRERSNEMQRQRYAAMNAEQRKRRIGRKVES